MLSEDYASSGQDRLASEIYRIREKSMASSRKSHSNICQDSSKRIK